MTRLQIELNDAQQAGLDALARDTGKSQQELLGEALDRFLDENDMVDWRGALQRLEGIWADRDDLPNFDEIRKEWDRDLWSR